MGIIGPARPLTSNPRLVRNSLECQGLEFPRRSQPLDATPGYAYGDRSFNRPLWGGGQVGRGVWRGKLSKGRGWRGLA